MMVCSKLGMERSYNFHIVVTDEKRWWDVLLA
jgi:hypothetical protein